MGAAPSMRPAALSAPPSSTTTTLTVTSCSLAASKIADTRACASFKQSFIRLVPLHSSPVTCVDQRLTDANFQLPRMSIGGGSLNGEHIEKQRFRRERLD